MSQTVRFTGVMRNSQLAILAIDGEEKLYDVDPR